MGIATKDVCSMHVSQCFQLSVIPGDMWLPPIKSSASSNASHTDYDSYSSTSGVSATPPTPSSGWSSASSEFHELVVSAPPRFPSIDQNDWKSVDNVNHGGGLATRRRSSSQRQKMGRSPSCPQLYWRDGAQNLVAPPAVRAQQCKHCDHHRRASYPETECTSFPSIPLRKLPGIRESGVTSGSLSKMKAKRLSKPNSHSESDIAGVCDRGLDRYDSAVAIPPKYELAGEAIPNRNALLWPISEADLKTVKLVGGKKPANVKVNKRNCSVNSSKNRRGFGHDLNSETTRKVDN